MSGIAGIVYLNQIDLNNTMLLKMKDKLIHRGIDGINLYSKKNIGFIHLMLHVTPESIDEIQPFTSTEKNTITADARIDNRNELIEQLALKPTYGKVITDSEIILAAYEHWGEECLYHLIGDFAFAIWDEKKQQVFCGRDHMGVRPFYYFYKEGEVFAFASEIKALLALDFVSNNINNEKVVIYLSWLSDNRAYKNDTFYTEIVSLQPAHSLKVNNTEISQKFCWDFNLERFKHLTTENDYVEAFRSTFIEAVRCRTRTNFGIASHLSGGLDSSSVSAVAARFSELIHTFHFDCLLPSTDEKKYVDDCIGFINNLEHHIILPNNDLQEASEFIAKVADAPDLMVISSLPHIPLYESVKKNNCRVLLTGNDGDSVVGYGTEYLDELWKNKQFGEFEKTIEAYIEKLENVNENWDNLGFGAKKVYALSTILKVIASKLFQEKKYMQLLMLFVDSFKLENSSKILMSILKPFTKKLNRKAINKSIISEDFAEKINLQALIVKNYQHNVSIPKSIRKKFFEIYNGAIVEGNEQQNNMGLHNSFIVCHPFFDKRLIELCLTIPAKYNFGEGLRRNILRQSMANYIPESVRFRTSKVNFFEFLKLKVTEILDKVDSKKDFYNQKVIDRYIYFLNHKDEPNNNQSVYLLARVLYLNQWLNLNLKHNEK